MSFAVRCSALACARTFADLEVFFLTRMSSEKTIKISFAAVAAKLCEAAKRTVPFGTVLFYRSLVSQTSSPKIRSSRSTGGSAVRFVIFNPPEKAVYSPVYAIQVEKCDALGEGKKFLLDGGQAFTEQIQSAMSAITPSPMCRSTLNSCRTFIMLSWMAGTKAWFRFSYSRKVALGLSDSIC